MSAPRCNLNYLNSDDKDVSVEGDQHPVVDVEGRPLVYPIDGNLFDQGQGLAVDQGDGAQLNLVYIVFIFIWYPASTNQTTV